MASESDAVVVGLGPGAGSGLAYFAPTGTALPADALAPLAAAYQDAGWISEDGLTGAVEEDTTDINAYGSLAPIRRITTSSAETFELTFLESNATSLAVYFRLDLDDVDLSTGEATITTGGKRTATYTAVFEIFDGDKRIRIVAPRVEVTEVGDFTTSGTDPVSYPVTLTAYPDSNGNSTYRYYVVPALDTTP